MTVVPCPTTLASVAVPPDFREAVYLAQAQSRAPAHVLGGEEGLENLGEDVGSYSGPGVGDVDRDEIARQAVCGGSAIEPDRTHRDGERAAVRHGVLRIDRKIEQSEFEFAGIDLDRAWPAQNANFGLDVAAQRPASISELRQPAREVDHLRRQSRRREKVRSWRVSVSPRCAAVAIISR